jgi:hypothetical protein
LLSKGTEVDKRDGSLTGYLVSQKKRNSYPTYFISRLLMVLLFNASYSPLLLSTLWMVTFSQYQWKNGVLVTYAGGADNSTYKRQR